MKDFYSFAPLSTLTSDAHTRKAVGKFDGFIDFDSLFELLPTMNTTIWMLLLALLLSFICQVCLR
jgi:hypothetical protein